MKNTMILLMAACTPLFGGQSFFSGSASGTITFPSGMPPVTQSRVEIRLTNIAPCPSAAQTGNNIVDLMLSNSIRLFGLACTGTGGWGLRIGGLLGLNENNYTDLFSDAEMSGKTDVIIRWQKNHPSRQWVAEAWTPESSKPFATRISGDCGTCAASQTVASGTRTLISAGNNGKARIAWIRWYGTALPLGSAMPKNSSPSTENLIARWEFEGNLEGGGAFNLRVSYNAANCPSPGELSSCFSPSPSDYPPLVQAAVSNAVAGGQMVLDASESFRWDDNPLDNVRWRWKFGPAEPLIAEPRSPRTPVTRLVAGKHTFHYTVAGVEQDLVVDVENLDAEGMPVYPSNTLHGSLTVPFRLADVPGAADVIMTVRKPDGRLLPPVVCQTSPCVVPIDDRQSKHQIQIAYRNAAGVVQVESDWQEVAVARKPQRHTYLASEGKTYSKYGEYLVFNLSNNEPSRKFLGKRVRYSVTGIDPPSPLGKYADFSKDAVHLFYVDSRAIYPREVPEMRAIADKYGFVLEDMFLHMKSDNAFYYALYKWQGMDRFDAAELSNGVLLHDGTTFTDRSNAAWDKTPGDVAFTASNNRLYVGYMEPFDRINIEVATSNIFGTVAVQYSTGQGTWGNLVVKDDTRALDRTGRISFLPPVDWKRASYNGSEHPKYWVRITVSGSSRWPILSRVYGDDWKIYDGRVENVASANGLAYTGSTQHTSPYTHGVRLAWTPSANCASNQSSNTFATLNVNGLGPKKLYTRNRKTGFADVPLAGDSMGYDCNKDREIVLMYDSALDGGSGGFRMWNLNRGWCETDGNGNDRIKAADGSWEYDPTPGPGCSAHFRYQARLLFGWAPNNFSANLADIQLGERSRARYLVDYALSKFVRDGVTEYNGIFLDDLSLGQPNPEDFQYPVARAQPFVYTELGPLTDSQELDLLIAGVRDVRTFLRRRNPSFKVGVNAQAWRLTRESDLALHEWGMHVYAGRGWRYTVNPSTDGNITKDVLGRDGFGGEGTDRYSVQMGTGAHGAPVHSIHTYIDTTSEFAHPSGCASNCTGWWLWDRGNRGPLMALAMYYLGASDYTSFFYCQSALAMYYQSDEYQYWDETPDTVLTADLPQNFAMGNTKTLQGDFSRLPAGATLVRIGQQTITLNKTSETTGTTTAQIAQAYPAGTALYIVKTARASIKPAPPAERVYKWFSYFPARDIDVGVPDTSASALLGDSNTSGIPQRGFRKLVWYPAGAGADGGGLVNEISRRDFTKAIVLFASGHGVSGPEFSVYSRVLDLKDANGAPITVYPLRADGRTGGYCGPNVVPASDGGCPGKIQLRNGEGLVLMKQQIF